MVPIVATPDFYHDAVYEGGALRYALVHGWLEDQNALDLFDQLKAHRLWDSWWAGWAVLPNVATVNVPALHIGGWYDVFQQGSLGAFAQFQHNGGPGAVGRQRLVIGPWTHYGTFQPTAGQFTYPANSIYADDIFSVVHEWFDLCLKGEESGAQRWPVVQVYLMGAVGQPDAPGNTWLALPDWPPLTALNLLFLDASHGLSKVAPPAGEIGLVADPADPVPTTGGQELSSEAGPYDQREIEALFGAQLHHARARSAADRDRSRPLHGLDSARHAGRRSRRAPDGRLPGRALHAGHRRHSTCPHAVR